VNPTNSEPENLADDDPDVVAGMERLAALRMMEREIPDLESPAVNFR